PVAAQANYVDRAKRHVLFHVSGRDERVRDLSVGLMSQAHCIRWAIANGMKRFDFTIGNEPYKYSLGGVDRHIVSAEVATLTGTNVADTLDKRCKEDVLTLIQRYQAAGNSEKSRKAAAQAIQTWPDLNNDDLLRSLTSPS
ncbi:MAG: GNAT family N-acetyltransferase, partial [Pseudomonadota bacterium]